MQWFFSFLTPNFNAFTSGLQITVSSIHRQKHLGICLPTVGSQTWVRSGWEFFRPSGESNPRPWRWIKPARDQHVKCNERRTRPCHRAYNIRGSTPFHLCVEVRSPKLVSSEDRIGARAPTASYCSIEGVAPLHNAPSVPVCNVNIEFGNLKSSDNSQDYALKPQRNCTFTNSASVQCCLKLSKRPRNMLFRKQIWQLSLSEAEFPLTWFIVLDTDT